MNQNTISFSSKARRFTRRLSYGISKVLREWNQDGSDASSFSKSGNASEKNPRIFNIEDLIQQTKFSRSEIQFIYRDFKEKCPNGILTEKSLVDIYSQLFSCGDCTIYAKHLFAAMTQQSSYSPSNSMRKMNQEINFKEFIIALSAIMRGTAEEKIRWLFNFYDLNKDGKVSQDEIASMVRSLYDLMGNNVNPPVDEIEKSQHVEMVLKKLGLDDKYDKSMTYNEFYLLFSNVIEIYIV